METGQIKKRDVTFDIVRSICIIQIVCIWHISNYLDPKVLPEWFMSVFGRMSGIALATFSFMSSFFLKRKRIEKWMDVKTFYMSRFKRFWIPFFVASSLLYFASSVAGQPWYSSTYSFLLSLIGFSIFVGQLPPTLWFMVMIMFFYIITPLLLYKKSRVEKIMLCVLIFMVFVVLHKVGYLDGRVLQYYPFYALGIIIPDLWSEKIKKNKYISFSIFTALSLELIFLIEDNSISRWIVKMLSIPIILSLSSMLSRSKKICYMAEIVSYSSMNMYFFHRHIFLTFVILLNIYDINNIREATIPVWCAFLICCPALIAFSYFLQKAYDKLINYIH